MLPPMVIFKGKRALKNLHIPAGVVVAVQPKAWNDAALIKIRVQKVICRYTQKQHALLVWDTFSGHMTEDVYSSGASEEEHHHSYNSRRLHQQDTASGCVFEQTLQEQLSQPVVGIHAATSRPARARRAPEASIKAASC